MKPLSRREFGTLIAASAVATRVASPRAAGQNAAGRLTAGELIDRIRQRIGVDWKADTVDTLKAGDGATVVTGVVTTAMATLGVLQQAVKAGANVVVTCEPTFYGRADSRTLPAGRGGRGGPGGAAGGRGAPAQPPRPDPVLAAKNAFVDDNRLVIFRLSEHWRLRRPDPFAEGLGDALGWSAFRAGADAARYDIPAVALAAFANDVRQKLGIRGGMRVVGRLETQVRRVALLPGSTPLAASLAALPPVDLVLAGEVREWESVEYARDAVYSGQAKALVLVGRVVSEDPGMAACAKWLQTIVSETPVRHIPVGDPYWRPEA